MRIYIAGADGMLGKTILKHLSLDGSLHILGTIRGDISSSVISPLTNLKNVSIIGKLSISDEKHLLEIILNFRPDIIINCIGLRRNPRGPDDATRMIQANSVWPHRLAAITESLQARLIHFSSDAVFSGREGQYSELDNPDPNDFYGRSKLLGEPDSPHCLTIRTSMIGRKSKGSSQLLDWLMNHKGPVNGYMRTIFSGLPTIEIARILKTIVLSRKDLSGTWHLASNPICKFDLLRMIAKEYKLKTRITPIPGPIKDLSLDASKFCVATGYVTPSWPKLISDMHEFDTMNQYIL